MSTVVKLNQDNVVVSTLYIDDEDPKSVDFKNQLLENTEYMDVGETPVAPNYKYYEEDQEFRPKKPFASWVWDSSVRVWDAPIPNPSTQDAQYFWSESLQEWILED